MIKKQIDDVRNSWLIVNVVELEYLFVRRYQLLKGRQVGQNQIVEGFFMQEGFIVNFGYQNDRKDVWKYSFYRADLNGKE